MILKIWNQNNNNWSYYSNIKIIRFDSNYVLTYNSFQKQRGCTILYLKMKDNGINNSSITHINEELFDYYKMYKLSDNDKNASWTCKIANIEFNDGCMLPIGFFPGFENTYLLNDNGKLIEKV